MDTNLMSELKVSVPLITYNHSSYIEAAIESALSQEADFRYEIVVGEDCSTDDTRDIVTRYQAKYPDIIRLLPRDVNLGMQRNYRETVCACQGEYVANLDGDDYWTSPHKLASQVRFMDSRPDLAMSFHRARIEGQGKHAGEIIPNGARRDLGIDDLLIGNSIPSCSCMYRRTRLPESWPDWYDDVPSYDWALHCVVLGAGGTAGFIDEVMAVYRVHSRNAWSSQGERERLLSEVGFYERIIPGLPESLKPRARLGMAARKLDLANNYRRAGKTDEARQIFEEALALESKGNRLKFRRKMRLRLRLGLTAYQKTG